MSRDRAFVVQVSGGEDDKARLEVGKSVRTIGRAQDADLPLRDRTVSRHHVQVFAGEGGVHFALCGGATRFLVDGRPLRTAEVRAGETVVIGRTSLVVHDVAEEPSLTSERTDVTSLLTGAVGDARGLADVYALVESLDDAEDTSALEANLAQWASDHDVALGVEVIRDLDGAAASTADLIERREGADGAVLSVPAPAPGKSAARLEFTVSAGRVTSSQKRMLVVAGRIFGSALTRVRKTDVAAKETAALRTLHFGSARAFLGTSRAAQQLANLVPRLAAAEVNVLIEGETGVGKTFIARLVHEGGPRSREPLRVINCASIPESLLESELFGHERGAFTGATAARAGALEAAGAGTLFLDEIGELSLASQAKLLRALEEKKFERLGSNRTLDVRARVLCATNRDLSAMAKEGTFRSDLLFRISVVKLSIPPLRERGEDLVLLADQILRDVAQAAPRRVEGFAEAALEAIRRYSWPGNMRELRNAIEHAIVLGDERLIQPTDLPAGIQASPEDPPDRGTASLLLDAVDSAERRAITEALRAAGGNRTRAAALLGVSRVTLYNKLRRM